MNFDMDVQKLFSELKVVKCLPKETKKAITVLDYLKMMNCHIPNL